MLSDDIAYFLAIAESGSLVRAAENLGLTQPALSKALRRLEQRVGVCLVTRTTQGSELTPSGVAFAARMHLLTRDANDASQEARDLGGGHAGQLKIGASPAASSFTLNALLPTLLNERPAATISFTNAFSGALIDALVHKDIELALCPLSDRIQVGLETELLFDDSYNLLINTQHPLATKSSISLHDMTQCIWASSSRGEYARQQMEAIFAREGFGYPKVQVEVNGLPALLLVISNTNLVSIVNSRGVLPGHLPSNVVMRPIIYEGIHCPIGMIWRRGYVSSVTLRAMQLLRKAIELA